MVLVDYMPSVHVIVIISFHNGLRSHSIYITCYKLLSMFWSQKFSPRSTVLQVDHFTYTQSAILYLGIKHDLSCFNFFLLKLNSSVQLARGVSQCY